MNLLAHVCVCVCLTVRFVYFADAIFIIWSLIRFRVVGCTECGLWSRHAEWEFLRVCVVSVLRFDFRIGLFLVALAAHVANTNWLRAERNS